MRDFAQRVMSYDAAGKKSSGQQTPSVFPVCDKLRPHLATLMGNAGFRALLSRALALASAEVPSLRAVHVKSDGSLEGLDQLGPKVDPEENMLARVVLLAQLIGLLTAFIGENLTGRLVCEVWPELRLNDLDAGKGTKNEKTK